MVLKTATCRFSGLRIYPGRGIIFVRVDGQVQTATTVQAQLDLFLVLTCDLVCVAILVHQQEGQAFVSPEKEAS